MDTGITVTGTGKYTKYTGWDMGQCSAVINAHLTHLLCWSIPYWHSSSDCRGCDQQWLDALHRRPFLSTLSRSGRCRMPSVVYRWYWASPWEDLQARPAHCHTTDNTCKHKSTRPHICKRFYQM